jgi:hypothetical protein
MIEFTHATTRYKCKPENAQAIRDALTKPKKHKPVALSSVNLKRSYPEFFTGMTTAAYVRAFNLQFDGMQHKIKHDCANYYNPAPMLDASIPECVEDENPDYVYEPKKVKKSLAQQLADADNKLDAAYAQIDALDNQVKTYRAALMALEAEVSFGMRDFIREVLG